MRALRGCELPVCLRRGSQRSQRHGRFGGRVHLLDVDCPAELCRIGPPPPDHEKAAPSGGPSLPSLQAQQGTGGTGDRHGESSDQYPDHRVGEGPQEHGLDSVRPDQQRYPPAV